MNYKLCALLCLWAAPLAMLARTDDDFTAHDFSHRCSLVDVLRIEDFENGTEEWRPTAGGHISWPEEADRTALLDVDSLPADRWRGIMRDFARPIDLGERNLMSFCLHVASARPGWEVYVRLTLAGDGDTCTYRTEIIPSLWQTVNLYVADCPFRHRITHMAIEVQNASSEAWNGCQLRFDEVMAGRPIDLEFQLPGSTDAFQAQKATVRHEDDALRLDFQAGATLSTTLLRGSCNSIYNPPLEVYNTIFMVMENRSDVRQMRVWFLTDGQQDFTREASKVIDIEPQSGKQAYYANLSDLPTARGRLTGLRFEPIGPSGGTLLLHRINFQKEEPIEDFAGAIDRCTASTKYVRVEGHIDPELASRYPILEIYEAPMHLYGPVIRTVEELSQPTVSREQAKPGSLRMKDVEHLACLYRGASAQRFSIRHIPNRRPDGKISLLGSRMLAIIRDEKGRAMKVGPCFYVENWQDFGPNPYAFRLPDRDFDVCDYGARGDAFTDDTEAINRAIDACNAAGGGRVVLRGNDSRYGRRYIATEIRLKSNVELHLDRGAVLWQSPDRRDYRYNVYYGHDMDIPGVPWTHCLYINMPLVMAKNTENVRVTGPGVIRMNDPYTENPHWAHYAKICSDCIHIVPLAFIDSKNLEATDIDIQRCNNYHTTFHGVDSLFLGNVKLYDIKCVSGDGLSFGQGARHIRVVRTMMNTNDDGIVMSNSYGDPRGVVTPWRQDHPETDHSIRDLKVTHSYINSTHGAGKAIAFIPWGTTNPDQQKQVIENIEVADCMLIGGYSVGTWPDNPFDGKPFTNGEQDDYAPVYNVNIHDNDYNDPCDMLCVRPTNFRGDTGIRSAGFIQNPDFRDGFCYWTIEGDAGVEHHQGFARRGGKLWEGLYLQGDINVRARVKGTGFLFIADERGHVLARQKVKAEGWTEASLALSTCPEANYRIGIAGRDIQAEWIKSLNPDPAPRKGAGGN